jgi:Tol biopolymer transport system component
MILSKGGSPDLYVCNSDGSGLKQLTKTREDESSPCWSPDGRSICYVSSSTAPSLQIISADGGAPRRIRTVGAGRVSEPDWSPDGKYIVFTAMRREFEICLVPAEGGESKTIVKLFGGQGTINVNSWSPDNRTIAFVSYRLKQ